MLHVQGSPEQREMRFHFLTCHLPHVMFGLVFELPSLTFAASVLSLSVVSCVHPAYIHFFCHNFITGIINQLKTDRSDIVAMT